MYNLEKNENASQFMITFKPLTVLNGRHVVFGRVVAGMKTLRLVCIYFTKMDIKIHGILNSTIFFLDRGFGLRVW
jgi:cyclophilin family peptidyl-prolyl cis-trans isomerase